MGTGYVGLRVRLLRETAIPWRNPLTDELMEVGEEDVYAPDEVFVVEHDFRACGEESGIRVAIPRSRDPESPRPSWMALTSAQFEELFGSDALATLDAAAATDEEDHAGAGK